MHAVVYSPGGLHMVTDRKCPLPMPKDKKKVLIKVHAASLSPLDVGLKFFALHRGHIAGRDFAGEIIYAPFGCDLQVGDMVFGNAAHFGTMAEYIYAHVDEIAIKPAGVSFRAASSIPTCGLAAYQALKKHDVKSGWRILVVGAAGGCGCFAVEIAKAMGARVTGLCGPKHVEFVKSLGADEVCSYNDSVALHSLCNMEGDAKFDLIFDTVSSINEWDYETKMKGSLKASGVYVALNQLKHGDTRKRSVGKQRSQFDLVKVHSSPSDLTQLGLMLVNGQIKDHSTLYYLHEEHDCRDAYDSLIGHHTQGKIVFDCIHERPRKLETPPQSPAHTATATVTLDTALEPTVGVTEMLSSPAGPVTMTLDPVEIFPVMMTIEDPVEVFPEEPSLLEEPFFARDTTVNTAELEAAMSLVEDLIDTLGPVTLDYERPETTTTEPFEEPEEEQFVPDDDCWESTQSDEVSEDTMETSSAPLTPVQERAQALFVEMQSVFVAAY